jgi:aminopeptidase N
VFEEVSGTSLDTFFKQWLYTPGQPELDIGWRYSSTTKTIAVTVEQKQETLFAFPLEIVVQSGSKSIMKKITVRSKKTVFTVHTDRKPDAIMADPQVNLLFEGTVKETEKN